ncbi:MAG: hypothetical protein Kow0068_22120 [Marinilabiliales bacterium]
MGLFGRKKKIDTSENNKHLNDNNPDIRFGRFTDMNKSQEQLQHWNNCMSLFKQGNHKQGLVHFLQYIYDKKQDNVSWKEDNEKIIFDIIQGSKIIHGYADDKEFVAESFIASFDKPSIPVMRKLMTLNYSMKYSWFAIQDNKLCMKYTTDFRHASPYQLFDALKELATQVDKQDDLLINEFDSLHQIEAAPIKEISLDEKEIKYNFLIKSINESLNEIKKLDEEKHSGAISYNLLSLIYKLDFLLSPEGVLTNTLEGIHTLYFRKPPQGQKVNYIELNRKMIAEIEKIIHIPKDDIFKSFYVTKETFSVLVPANYKKIADFIFNESKNFDYYYNNRMDYVNLWICEYIAGYCLFIYGMYPPLYNLMKLYMKIFNNQYFKDLGFNQNFLSDNILNKKEIELAIDAIVKDARKDYPNFNFNKSMLKYDSLVSFSVSFFKEFDFLNFSK